MNMRKISIMLLLSLCCLPARADTIFLKNGGRIEGAIIEERDGTVTVKMDIGTMTFTADEIDSVENAPVKKAALPAKKSEGVKAPRKPQKSAPTQIEWLYDFDEGMALARKSDKPVMVDFYTDWCGWCGKLDKDTYSSGDVIALSSGFINIKIDADRNRPLVSRYGIRGYPTVLFLDPSGSVTLRVTGYLPAAEFIKKMRRAAK
jgi:thiol-disulfide isomerase/thioredoxin